MKSRTLTLLAIVLAASVLLLQQALFVVNQTEQALVIQLGHPLSKVYKPGLHIKVPFIQNVVYFEARILDYDARPAEALTSDLKSIVLDNYARWRIVDPLQFYRTMRTEANAKARIDAVIYSQMRAHVGRHTLTQVVADERTSIMDSVTAKATEQMREFGIEMIDVRIKRTDLPEENQRAIFDRMRAERERQATQYRSEGAEESTKIRSGAEKDRAVILADARRKAEMLRGEGEAEATRIYAEAFSRSPDFFNFQRGLEALKKSLGSNTRMILTPESPLIKPLN